MTENIEAVYDSEKNEDGKIIKETVTYELEDDFDICLNLPRLREVEFLYDHDAQTAVISVYRYTESLRKSTKEQLWTTTMPLYVFDELDLAFGALNAATECSLIGDEESEK